jgi:hypothetical protein
LVHFCYFDTAPSGNAASLALLSLVTAAWPQNFDAGHVAWMNCQLFAAFLPPGSPCQPKVDDKPPRKFILDIADEQALPWVQNAAVGAKRTSGNF